MRMSYEGFKTKDGCPFEYSQSPPSHGSPEFLLVTEISQNVKSLLWRPCPNKGPLSIHQAGHFLRLLGNDKGAPYALLASWKVSRKDSKSSSALSIRPAYLEATNTVRPN